MKANATERRHGDCVRLVGFNFTITYLSIFSPLRFLFWFLVFPFVSLTYIYIYIYVRYWEGRHGSAHELSWLFFFLTFSLSLFLSLFRFFLLFFSCFFSWRER